MERYSSIGPTLRLVAFFSVILFEGVAGCLLALQCVCVCGIKRARRTDKHRDREQTAYVCFAGPVMWGRRDLVRTT